MTEKAEKDKAGAGKRRSIGKFIDRIFRGRSQSLPASAADEIKKEAKSKKKKLKNERSASESIDEDEFGVVATERLTHFQKPKPPPNRRRPRGVPQTSSSTSVVFASKVETIPEEEDESISRIPESESPQIGQPENGVVVKDKMVEVPKLFTPALPPASAKPKLIFKKPKEADNESAKAAEEGDRKSESSGSIKQVSAGSEVELRKTSSESFAVIDNDDNVDADVASTKKSTLSLSKSLSGKIDFEQIRAKSKNLRLVKSLEVGHKIVAAGDGKSRVRVSDPGRQ